MRDALCRQNNDGIAAKKNIFGVTQFCDSAFKYGRRVAQAGDHDMSAESCDSGILVRHVHSLIVTCCNCGPPFWFVMDDTRHYFAKRKMEDRVVTKKKLRANKMVRKKKIKDKVKVKKKRYILDFLFLYLSLFL